MAVDDLFNQRAGMMASVGLGLSVDVYTPDLFELIKRLEQQDLRCDYLEIFRAAPEVLKEVRRRLPRYPLAFHAEGLWLTQPDWLTTPVTASEIAATIDQLAIVDSRWVNHECATKQMSGYTFGTYLPPLFTEESADVVAHHARVLQQTIDAAYGARPSPLVLLEVPPLTYFALGDLSVGQFFSRLAQQAPCGLVLDIGHVWTIYRYSGAWRRQSVTDFWHEFLESFPLDRVIQIHVAGLDAHHLVKDPDPIREEAAPPLWIDAHAAPIRPVVWDMLAQVLAHPRLTTLKGVALEVDTKAVTSIAAELEYAIERFGSLVRTRTSEQNSCMDPRPRPLQHTAASHETAGRLAQQYRLYAETAVGKVDHAEGLLAEHVDHLGLHRYRTAYLPDEILYWGGDLREMFPDTCRRLDAQAIHLTDFVAFWFRWPRRVDAAYDFFLLKVERFCAFVSDVLPDVRDVVTREAAELRVAYQFANDPVLEPEPVRP